MKFDIIEPLEKIVRDKVKDFLAKHSLDNKFDELEKKANEAKVAIGPLEYFNELTNGAVDIVADNTKENYQKVQEDFLGHYFSVK